MLDSRKLVIEQIHFEEGGRGWAIRRDPGYLAEKPLVLAGEDEEGFVAQGTHLYWGDSLEEVAALALADYPWLDIELWPAEVKAVATSKKPISPACGPRDDDWEFWEMVG
jgi:hypothetical protein